MSCHNLNFFFYNVSCHITISHHVFESYLVCVLVEQTFILHYSNFLKTNLTTPIKYIFVTNNSCTMAF